jgi:phosphate transport system substrate-binding protein
MGVTRSGFVVVVVPIALTVLAIVGLVVGNKVIKRLSLTALITEGIALIWAFAQLVTIGYDQGGRLVWVPGILAGAAEVIVIIRLWPVFDRRRRNIITAVIASAAVVLTTGLVVRDIHERRILVVRSEEAFDLNRYQPFTPDTLAKTASGAPTLALTDDLPRLDGATALYPLYASFVQSTYPRKVYEVWAPLPPDYPSAESASEIYTEVTCSTTAAAFDNLISGEADLIFLMDVSDEQRAAARERGLELKLTPIGREAFVFIVNQRNRVSNLTADQVRDIYSGEITNWSEVGGARRDIEAYQRPPDSGSQTALQKIMGDRSIMPPKIDQVYASMGGLYDAVADYKNYQSALGYSFRYYLNEMIGGDEVKLLSIDGVEPTLENIRNGEYPFTQNFYAVTVTGRELSAAERARAENAERLIDWIGTSQGQELVEKVGYVRYEPR